MTTTGSARLRKEEGDLRQSVVGEAQARQGEVRAAMHSVWCWAVMRAMTSMKASLKAALVCWDSAGWQRKRGTGCVWEMWVVSVVLWTLKRKRAGVVVVVEAAMVMWFGVVVVRV